jgi:hypothetical protein
MNAAIKALPVRSAFTTNENPLSGGGAWTPVMWHTSASGHATGWVQNGWGPYDSFGVVNGAFWTNAWFSDTGAGTGVSAKLTTAPTTPGEYFSLWLNGQTPTETKAGYELRFEYLGSGSYKVTLSKWQAGSKTSLGSKASLSLPLNSAVALTKKSTRLTAQVNTGTEYVEIIVLNDSGFGGGFTGIEGSGNVTRIKDFASGPLSPF